MTSRTALLLLIVLSASACASAGPATPARSGCEWTRYIWLSPADILSERTEAAILAHNEARLRVCGPPAAGSS